MWALIAIKAGIANHVIATHLEEAREALTVIEGHQPQGAARRLRATLKVLRREHVDQQQDLQPLPGLSDLPSLRPYGRGGGARQRQPAAPTRAEEPPDGVAR
ncbi:hypothetical protein ACRAWF_31605 [Streptomyces sp. L7]